MAALDFGMALSRGMLPTSEKAQKDLINLAGGRNIFKSEDWWNTQVDKQISSGYRVEETRTQYYIPKRQTGGFGQSQTGWRPPSYNIAGIATRPLSATSRREVNLGYTGKREDYTAGELADIERSAKAGAKRAKRETAQAETSKKRLRRGTGGLAAKARPVGAEATTGLPELGTGGLQLGTTSLGKGLLV